MTGLVLMKRFTFSFMVFAITFGFVFSYSLSEKPLSFAQSEAGDEASAAPEQERPKARENFQSLVISGLSPSMSRSFDQLCEDLRNYSGIDFQPRWWRLDMAAFSSKAPFHGQDLAAKLGLQVVSDVSDDLILAPRNLPRAQQAEARLFLMDLFMTQKNLMWLALAEYSSLESMPAKKTVSIDIQGPAGLNEAIEVELGEVLNEEPKVKEKQKTMPGIDIDDVFGLEGSLADEKIQRALGLDPAKVSKPLLHYSLRDFFVSKDPFASLFQGKEDKGHSEYDYYGHYDHYGRDEPEGVYIWAMNGEPAEDIPADPADGFFDGDFFDDFIDPFGGFDMEMKYGRRYGYPDFEENSQPEIAPSPGYVCLRLENFKIVSEPDQNQGAETLRSIVAMVQGKESLPEEEWDSEEYKQLCELQQKFILHASRTVRPQAMRWVDQDAVIQQQDLVDDESPVRKAKREVVETVQTMFEDYLYRMEEGEPEFREGNLGDWSLRDHYQIESWSLFDIPPYSDYMFSLRKAEDSDSLHAMILETEQTPTPEMKFKVQIDPYSGNVLWLQGEPQPEILMARRYREIEIGLRTLFEEVQAGQIEGAEEFSSHFFEPDWIGETLEKHGVNLYSITRSSFQLERLLPWIVRIEAGRRKSFGSQVLVYNLQTKQVYRETLEVELGTEVLFELLSELGMKLESLRQKRDGMGEGASEEAAQLEQEIQKLLEEQTLLEKSYQKALKKESYYDYQDWDDEDW